MNKNELAIKIIDLCLAQNNQNSKNNIEILYRKIKRIESQKEVLLMHKPYWFQKKKMRKFNDELENMNNSINTYIMEIEKELSTI